MKDSELTYLQYMSALVGCYSAMPDSEKELLHAWETENIDGSGAYATSDWPGWKKYIGLMRRPQKCESDSFGYVYLLKCGANNYKIGVSVNVALRIAALQTGNPNLIRLVHKFPSADAKADETKLHKMYAHCGIRNEWFSLSEEEVAHICSISGTTDAT